jgi:hypothetical protein
MIARVRRLRQPKYLLGAVVGCAYFYFFFFRNLGTDRTHRMPSAATAEAMRAIEAANAALPVDWLPATTALGALALLVFITFMWVVPTQRAALGFTEAEIAFLFPAPISRRALVHFRLLSSQLRSLVGAAVMMLFSNRWTIVGGNALTHAIGWWFIFSTLNLHFSGANFTLTRLTDAGLAAWRRRTAVLAAIIAVFAVTIVRLPADVQLPPMGAEIDLRSATDWLVALTATAPLRWLLLPFTVVLGPFLAVDPLDFLLALAPAVLVITVHYLWVVRSAVAFEDASVDYAQKRGARIAAWRSGQRQMRTASSRGRPGPFRLASTGRAEVAFLWKNLLSTWPYFTTRVLLISAAVIIAAIWWLSAQPAGASVLPSVGLMASFFAAYTLIVGPQFARQDIRSDLIHADVLKTYPLPGWQIVLGELLTPIVILTGVLWLTLLIIALTFQPTGMGFAWLTPSVRVACAIAMAAVIPALVTLQLLVPNAAALLFPGWFQLSRTRGGGPEVIGQRMIFFFAQVLTMVLALLPAAGMAALLIFILQALIGPIAAVGLAAFAVLVVLIGEAWCGLWWLGERFDRLDLSTELRS